VDDAATRDRVGDGLLRLALMWSAHPPSDYVRSGSKCGDSSGCAKSCLSSTGATHGAQQLDGGTKSCMLWTGATHGGSYGGVKSCMFVVVLKVVLQ
jgi:hypothetical protein